MSQQVAKLQNTFCIIKHGRGLYIGIELHFLFLIVDRETEDLAGFFCNARSGF